MIETWQRIEAWLAANAPAVLEGLHGPASDEAIAAAEAELGIPLPDDLKASLRLHDGEARTGGLFAGFLLLSAAEITAEWQRWSERVATEDLQDYWIQPAGPVRAVWFSPRWIPVTFGGPGDTHCLDLDPADGGAPGQVVLAWHDSDERAVLAPSFTAFLERFAERLEHGDYGWDASLEAIVEKPTNGV